METNFFEWGRLVMMGLQLVVGIVGMIAIFVGLVRMKEAGERRDKEIDVMAKNMQESTRVIGQALERQGAAMTQAFTQQGQVLAELLRRTA